MSFFKSLFSSASKDENSKISQKFENYVNYVSSDNNIKIRLPEEYKKDDVADYDFYAGYEDKLYLGMYVYNLDEYKGYTENQILNEQFSIMSKSRKMKIILSNQIKKYQDKITNTVVYLSKRKGYVDNVISMSTIRFYSMPNYIVYVVQTCSEAEYTIYKEILMKNLANIEFNLDNIEMINKEKTNNITADNNNNYVISSSGDFNLYLNYTDETDLQNSILHISKIISHNDSTVINEISNLMNNKDIYIKKSEREIDENCSVNTLFWLIMVDTLKKYNYICERDWKDEFEDFIYFLSNLKNFDIDINYDIFNKDESIIEWCKIIDSKYEPKCIGCIDIDSDSYVLFVSNNDEINELKQLSAEISKKIDYAKNC